MTRTPLRRVLRLSRRDLLRGAQVLGVAAGAVAFQVGWPFVKNPLLPFVQRLATAFGTPNFSSAASFCAIAGRMGRALTAGCDLVPDLERAKTLIVWGANPTHAAPPFAHQVA